MPPSPRWIQPSLYAAVVVTLTVGLGWTTALAQTAYTTENSTQVDPDALAGAPVLQRRLYCDITVLTIFGEALYIRETEQVAFKLVADVREHALSLHEGDSVRIFGFLVASQPRRTFTVKRIESRRNTLAPTKLREELHGLLQRRDVEGLYAFGNRLLTNAELSPELAAFAREAYLGGIAIHQETLDPSDRKALLRIADIFAKQLRDHQAALELLKKLLPPDGVPQKDIAVRLGEIRAVQYGMVQDWILIDERQQQEGFVLHNGAWVSANRIALLKAAETQIANPKTFPTGTRAFILAATRNGNLITGMTQREVVQVRGFPRTFDRVRLEGRVFDAWQYPDLTLFFDQDILFKK